MEEMAGGRVSLSFCRSESVMWAQMCFFSAAADHLIVLQVAGGLLILKLNNESCYP